MTTLEAGHSFVSERVTVGMPKTSSRPMRAIQRALVLLIVVKASGNALGKGVTVCDTDAEAEAAIDAMMVQRVFGDAGRVVVVV